MINKLQHYFAVDRQLVASRAGARRYINLDNAASTPAAKPVLEAVQAFLPWYSSVRPGNGIKSRVSTDVYEEARALVGKFVNADPAYHVVIFGKNTTEALNKLSYRLLLHKKDIVLISHMEHHSNDLPWRARATVKRIALDTDGGIDKQDFVRLLNKYAGRVRLVSITAASNVTGYTPDIHWFARKAHEVGALIAVDCAQLAAHRQIDMKAPGDPDALDYVAISGHKMYAPFGTGALIGRRSTFDRDNPEYRGGGTVRYVTTDSVDWANSPCSDEAGSPNVVGAVALARATQMLTQIGLENIAAHERTLANYALKRLERIPGITVYGSRHRIGVISFTVADMPPHLVSAVLGYEWGIGVSSGYFCAQPYVMSLLEVKPVHIQRNRSRILHGRRDMMPGMVRLSLGLYNTRQDIDNVASALSEIVSGNYGDYSLDVQTGYFTPAKMHPDNKRFTLGASWTTQQSVL